ncbi:hypothetical protein ACFQ4C_08880 [Larkinella insperata]|uniref:PIN domain-containing protein n=1 Tax=Larkinella insperata TaxID=332158 RepID=A0ABW3QD40_9BACT
MHQYLIDYVSIELEKAENEQSSGLSFGYRGDRFIPYFHPDDLQERQIQFWSGLRDWINRNCRPDYAWERLAWEWQREDADSDFIFTDRKMYMSSYWDTVLLANRPNRLLITDDLFAFVKLPSGFVIPVTTEWYLTNTLPVHYNTSLWLELIRLNMRGITLSGLQLYQAFSNNKLTTQVPREYIKALHSFEPKYNHSIQNLFEVVVFLKNLYADTLPLEYKRRTARTLFQVNLKGRRPISEQVLNSLFQIIDEKFNLLGDNGIRVKEDLFHCLEIMRLSNK